MLWENADRFAASVAQMTDEQLDVPGYGQYPYGLDPQLPFISIVWWMNRELIHHTAEVASCATSTSAATAQGRRLTAGTVAERPAPAHRVAAARDSR
jgi:hypothetical protein